MIYFIQSKSNGRIKIGSSSDPKKRLDQLQTGSSDELILLREFPGSRDEEIALHERFSEHRTDGEWFFPAKDIFDFIENPIRELVKVSGNGKSKDKKHCTDEQESREIPPDYKFSAGAKCDCGGCDWKPYLDGKYGMKFKGDGYHRDDCVVLVLNCDPEHSWIEDGEPHLFITFVDGCGTYPDEHYPWEPEEVEKVRETISLNVCGERWSYAI